MRDARGALSSISRCKRMNQLDAVLEINEFATKKQQFSWLAEKTTSGKMHETERIYFSETIDDL